MAILNTIQRIFGCDLRSLALFRLGLGAVLLGDLIDRARFLEAHYSDAGILPRALLLGELGFDSLSLHLASGGVALQGVLFVVAGIAACALLVGYRTRTATIVSLILLASLQARNPMILLGGDKLLLLLLFWGMFLPLGARFSVDASVSESTSPNTHYSIATMALLLQSMYVYFFGALVKTGATWLPDGTAIQYTLLLEPFATPLGVWMRDLPNLLRGLTYGVFFLELVAPLLVFSPVFHNPLRIGALTALVLLHVGFYVLLKVGIFPFVSLVSLLPFVPTVVWDRIQKKWRTPQRLSLRIYYDQPCSFCRKICLLLRTFLLLPEVSVLPAQGDSTIGKILVEQNSWVVVDYDGRHYLRWEAMTALVNHSPAFWPLAAIMRSRPLSKAGERCYRFIAKHRETLGRFTTAVLPYRPVVVELPRPWRLVVAILLVATLYHNLTYPSYLQIQLPEPWHKVTSTLQLNQHWNMFAPDPPDSDWWYYVKGELVDGSVVDGLRPDKLNPDWEERGQVTGFMADHRWRWYKTRALLPPWQPKIRRYGHYLCDQWNQRRQGELSLFKIQIIAMGREVRTDGNPAETQQHLLLDEECGVLRITT